jgi:hypothetical protein
MDLRVGTSRGLRRDAQGFIVYRHKQGRVFGNINPYILSDETSNSCWRIAGIFREWGGPNKKYFHKNKKRSKKNYERKKINEKRRICNYEVSSFLSKNPHLLI